jgi:alcohol dehydrogenase
VRSRDKPLAPDIELQGITAPTPGAQRLHAYFHDGSWAEQIRVPTENASALGPLSPAEVTQWIAMGRLLVPFGGLLAGELQPGEILVVNGATGPFGSAGVMVGLALGARAVIATGRNQRALGELARRLGPRVIPVAMHGGFQARIRFDPRPASDHSTQSSVASGSTTMASIGLGRSITSRARLKVGAA